MTRAGRPLMIMAAGVSVCFVTIQQAQAHPMDPHPARASISNPRSVGHSTDDAASRSGRSARSSSIDAVAASEWRSQRLDDAIDSAVRSHGKPTATPKITSAATSNGKAKGKINNGPKQGNTGHGKPGNTGIGTPSVLPPGTGSGSPGSSNGAQLESANLPTLAPGSVAAFPPVPPAPGADVTSPQSASPGGSSGTVPGNRGTNTTPPSQPPQNRSIAENVPYAATHVRSRADLLALLLLLCGFGGATTVIVVAAGYRGRRRAV